MKAASAMKGMKTMKVMKVMKAKAVSKIAKGKLMRAAVFSGRKEKTASGHKKSDLKKSKTSGKIITKAQHAAGKKAYSRIKAWTSACQKAKKELGVTGFVAVKKGSTLYKKAKELYSA